MCKSFTTLVLLYTVYFFIGFSVIDGQIASLNPDADERCNVTIAVASLNPVSPFYEFLWLFFDGTNEVQLASVSLNGNGVVNTNPRDQTYENSFFVENEPENLGASTAPFTSTLTFMLDDFTATEYRFGLASGGSIINGNLQTRSICSTYESITCGDNPCFCNSIAVYTCSSTISGNTYNSTQNQTCNPDQGLIFDECQTPPTDLTFEITSETVSGENITVLCNFTEGNPQHDQVSVFFRGTEYEIEKGISKTLDITLSSADQNQIIYCQVSNNFTVDNDVTLKSEITLDITFIDFENDEVANVSATVGTLDPVKVIELSCNPNITNATIYTNGNTIVENITLLLDYTPYTQSVSIKPTEQEWTTDYAGAYEIEVFHEAITGPIGPLKFQLVIEGGDGGYSQSGLEDWEIALIVIGCILGVSVIIAFFCFWKELCCFEKK